MHSLGSMSLTLEALIRLPGNDWPTLPEPTPKLISLVLESPTAHHMPRANIQSAVEAYHALYNEAKALNELVKQGKGNKEKMNHASQILNENLHLIAPILDGETAVGSYKSILAENRLLKTKLDKFNEYMDIFSKIDENFENWTKKIEESISERSMREEIEAATKDNLKVIVKEAVDAINKRFQKNL